MAAQNEPKFALFTSSDLDFDWTNGRTFFFTWISKTKSQSTIKWRNGGIINPLFDGLTYNTTGPFCSLLVFFLAPTGLGEILRNSQNIRSYYMLNHRIRCIYRWVPWFLEFEQNMIWNPGHFAILKPRPAVGVWPQQRF